MVSVLQHVIDAVSLGALYSVIALGIALVFGVMGLVNFAHGELIMVAGYVMVIIAGHSFALGIVGIVLTATVLAVLMERLAFRPARGAQGTTLMVTSFTVAVLIQNLALMSAGPLARGVTLPAFFSGSIEVGGLQIQNLDVLSVGLGFGVMLGLGLFLQRTDFGLMMRAAAEDFQMARLLAINSDRVISVAFGISGTLAAIAALLIVGRSGTVSPEMGLTPLLIGFVAVVVGGLGSLKGAVVGAFVLGIVTVVMGVVLPLSVRPFSEAFVFLAVIVVLLVKPQGLVPAKSEYVRV